MNDIIKSINDVANQIFQFILALLPDSPFRNISFGKEFDYWLGVLNYYVPFNSMVIIAGSWIACIAVYYKYQLILRKVSAIN